MAAPKGRALGKGLDSMIPNLVGEGKVKETKASAEVESVKEEKGPETMVKITKVEPNREQPRKYFDEDALQELADSIKQFGLLQPILVQDRQTYYEIIAGERRWRAAKLAGLKEVPVIIRNYTEQEIVEIALIENIQREDLNPIEEAQAYKKLIEEFHLKQDDVAERVSKSRTAITNILRLLKLTETVQEMVIDEKLTNGHARALIPIEDDELQYETACKVFDERLSVRETEKLVKKVLNDLANPKTENEEAAATAEDLSFLYREIEENFKSKLGAKTSIKTKNNGRGKIEIEYCSRDELEHIMELIYSIQM